MLNNDTLTNIQETAQMAAGLEDLGLTADGRARRYRLGAELKEIPIPPRNRAHTANTLAALVDFLADHQPNPDENQGPGPSAIWHDDSQVVGLLDDADRRDRVVFPLPLSREFARLLDLEEPQKFEQRDLVFMLRLHLGLPADIIEPFRKLAWTTTDNATGNTRRGQESMGAEILAAINDPANLPDELEIRVPIYDAEGEREKFPVRVLVEPLAREREIALTLKPGEKQKAIDNAQAALATRLASELQGRTLADRIPVYYGSPGE